MWHPIIGDIDNHSRNTETGAESVRAHACDIDPPTILEILISRYIRTTIDAAKCRDTDVSELDIHKKIHCFYIYNIHVYTKIVEPPSRYNTH